MLENSPAFVAGCRLPRRLVLVRTSAAIRAAPAPIIASPLSTHTALGRRVTDLAQAHLKALGNPTGIEQQAAVIAAGEMRAIATAALRKPGSVDLDQLVRLQDAADRAVRRIGISLKPPEPPPLPLHERLRRVMQAEHADDDAPEGLEPDDEEVESDEVVVAATCGRIRHSVRRYRECAFADRQSHRKLTIKREKIVLVGRLIGSVTHADGIERF